MHSEDKAKQEALLVSGGGWGATGLNKKVR